MPILCYHAVDDAWQSPLAIPPGAFAKQAAWLAGNKAPIPLSEAVARITRKGSLPDGRVSMTFDDGYKKLKEFALGYLLQRRIPATVFIVARTLVEPSTVDWVDDPPSEPLETMSLGEILELQDAGIEFGSHSWRHADLTQLTEEECLDDLRRSKEAMEDLLRGPVPFLAYPRGRHSDHVRSAARRAGYAASFSLPTGREVFERHAVPRAGMYTEKIRDLRMKTSKWYMPLRHSKPARVRADVAL